MMTSDTGAAVNYSSIVEILPRWETKVTFTDHWYLFIFTSEYYNVFRGSAKPSGV